MQYFVQCNWHGINLINNILNILARSRKKVCFSCRRALTDTHTHKFSSWVKSSYMVTRTKVVHVF